MTRLSLAALAALLAASAAPAADWPGWRGPTGMGISEEKDLPLTWGGKDGENVLWKQRLPGADGKAKLDNNQSSPIVQGGRVFVTVSYWPAGVDAKEYPEHHVACYKADDGTPLWDVKVEPGPWKLSDLRGGYTAPTPAADADRVYVLFGSSVLAALDHDGKPVWRKEITPYTFDVAIGCSPVLFGDVVLLQCDQNDKHSRLLAFDRKTGDLKWEKKRPEFVFTHSTPTLAEVNGKTELLVAASGALAGSSTRPTARCCGRARRRATPSRRSTRAASSTSTAAAAAPASPSTRPGRGMSPKRMSNGEWTASRKRLDRRSPWTASSTVCSIPAT